MAREFYLDDEYSPLGDGYYQPLYRDENGHEYEANRRDRWEVKEQLGLEYDDEELKYYDPDEVDFEDVNDDLRTYHSLSLWATAL